MVRAGERQGSGDAGLGDAEQTGELGLEMDQGALGGGFFVEMGEGALEQIVELLDGVIGLGDRIEELGEISAEGGAVVVEPEVLVRLQQGRFAEGVELAAGAADQRDFAAVEKIEGAGEAALRLARAFGHRFQFAEIAREPGDDEARLGELGFAEEDGGGGFHEGRAENECALFLFLFICIFIKRTSLPRTLHPEFTRPARAAINLHRASPKRSSMNEVSASAAGESQPVRIGDFELLDELGRGGMGTVYRARQVSLQRLVALKILPARWVESPEFLERFRREAIVAAGLSHPNLVRVYATGEIDGASFIVMELVEGENLRQHLRRTGPLPWREALRITLEVARGLQCGWIRAQLVHRDIKPGNIYLSAEGEVKVGDLGLAKSLLDGSAVLTQTGAAIGTPHYISPEQARGEKQLDFRADIYSLGCTLYEMLTGTTPYRGSDPITVITQHLTEPPPVLSKVLPGCPAPVAKLVSRMLRKAREERPASYEELITTLEQTLETDGRPAGSGLRKGALAMGSVAAIAIVGAVYLGLWRGVLLERKAATPPSVADAAAAWAKAARPGDTIELLPLIVLKRDALKGNWSLTKRGLSVKGSTSATVLELPYEVPDEYDFEIVFTPDSGGLNVNQYLSAGGHAFAWKLNSHMQQPPLYGFELLDGKYAKQTPEASTRRDLELTPGQTVISKIEVRRNSLRAFVNGKLFVSWGGDFARFSAEEATRLNNPRHIGVGAYKRAATFERISLTLVK